MAHKGIGKTRTTTMKTPPNTLRSIHLTTLYEVLSNSLFLLDGQGTILDHTANQLKMLRGTHISSLTPPSAVRQIFAAMQQAQATSALQVIQFSLSVEETTQFIEARLIAAGPDRYVCLTNTITDQIQMKETIHRNEEQIRMMLSSAPIVLFATDINGVITFAQGHGLKTTGYTSEQMVGHTGIELFPNFPEIHAAVHQAIAGETHTLTTVFGKKASEIRFSPLCDRTGQISGMIGIATDITERFLLEAALRHQSLHDSLTDLPNRSLLLTRMADTFAQADHTDLGMALLILDLDRFQEINDTFGHQYGDHLLQHVSARLVHAVDESATVARLGGDEFAIFLPVADDVHARTVAQAVAATLESPIQAGDYPVQVEASIGIALYPANGTEPLMLLRHADVAMYHAKRYHEKYALYDAQKDHYQPQRLALLGDLRKAIAENELRLYYQPKANLRTGEVNSVEALLRWQHATHGFIPPDQFIPLAEQTGLIGPLTQWVLNTAIAQCRSWLKRGIDLDIAVNLSMWNLREANLSENIASLLKLHQISSDHLCLEVTESAMMIDPAYTMQTLRHLSHLGLQISIDDYGTGYSSLAYIKQLSANELKIDRTFVQHVATDRADQAIVQSTITLAHQLGMKVVAEGVEDQAGWDRLVAYGCDVAQGYYLARPIPPQELEYWLQKRTEVAA